MRTGKQLLVETLHRLMRHKGWVKIGPKQPWNVGELFKHVPKKPGTEKGSRAWLYKILKGEKNFSIEEYDRILGAFKVPFEMAVCGGQSTRPDDEQDLHDQLDVAIADAKRSRTFESLKYMFEGLLLKSVKDRAIHDALHPISRASPPESREAGGTAKGTGHKTKI